MLPEKPMLARSYFRSVGGNVVVDGVYSDVRFEGYGECSCWVMSWG